MYVFIVSIGLLVRVCSVGVKQGAANTLACCSSLCFLDSNMDAVFCRPTLQYSTTVRGVVNKNASMTQHKIKNDFFK